MKSTAPWSIKGIDPDARDAAKKAARAAGMTLGEWMNQQILEAGKERAEAGADSPEPVQSVAANAITIDHLRELVASLNRLNDRLQTNERHSKEAISGLNQGLTTALDRIRTLQKERRDTSTEGLIDRIEKIEKGEVDRGGIAGLKALEKALTRTLEQFDSIRDETMARVEANESAIQGLSGRVDTMDEQFGQAIAALRENVEEVTDQIAETEATARAVMLEARAAAKSNDEEFIKRTSDKLRILGTEIKRTSDRIQSLDGKIGALSGKIEASEQRSAEGISRISDTVSALSQDLSELDREQGEAVREARGVIEQASRDADTRFDALKDSFDAMLMRVEGIADGERSAREMAQRAVETAEDASRQATLRQSPPPQATAPAGSAAPAEPAHKLDQKQAATPRPADIAAARSPSPQTPAADQPAPDQPAPGQPAKTAGDPMREAMKSAEDSAPSEEDFDAIFGEPIPEDSDRWFDDTTKAAAEAGGEIPHADGDDAGTRDIGSDDGLPPVVRREETLTPKQKVILAARARRKRLEEQAQADAEIDEKTTQARVAPLAADAEEDGDEETGFFGAVTSRFRPGKSDADDIDEAFDDAEPATERTRSRADEDRVAKMRRKYARDDNEGRSLPVISLVIFGIIAVAALGYILLSDTLTGNVSSIDRNAAASATTATDPATTQPAAPQSAANEPAALYEEAMAQLGSAEASARARGLSQLRDAAAQDYPPAQFQLGEAYRLGTGVQPDLTAARDYYSAAAEGGNVPAMHKLGSLYAAGEGGDKNDFTALSWFEQAATYGYLNSVYNLGLLYDPTVELEVTDQILDSAPQAYYWYSLAVRLGDSAAQEDVDRVAENLPTAQRQQLDQEVAAWRAQEPLPSANARF